MITLNHINVSLPKDFLRNREVQKNLHFCPPQLLPIPQLITGMKIKYFYRKKHKRTEKHQNPHNMHATLRTQEVFIVDSDSTNQKHLKCSANLNLKI